MTHRKEKQPTQVNANPTKDFFVSMLTRDIELEDAILDLLDNCVDGIQRKTRGHLSAEKPFNGYFARITFSGESFTIEDNCGGIPLDNAVEYAFRMGRPSEIREDEGLSVIGTYGIGMKRAIFKMGRDCKVESRTRDDCFSVSIPPEWFTDPEDWDFDLNTLEQGEYPYGTRIVVKELNKPISDKFFERNFESNLIARIAQAYSFILGKGFKVEVNAKAITPKPLSLLLDTNSEEKNVIRPYMYTDVINGVQIYLAVGFYRPMPSDEEIEDDETGTRYSSATAGWTVICNDRVVLYCDKTKLTGWGDAGVPGYHTQFITISGVVQFTSSDARELPITTTKRGIDASSEVYMTAKNYMREGMRLFTDYTNRWKSDKITEKLHSGSAISVPITQIATTIKQVADIEALRSVPKTQNAKRFKPTLPMPVSDPEKQSKSSIKFVKSVEAVKLVSGYLFDGDHNVNPSEVGEECFDFVLDRAKA
jgi:hypothetical protein